MITKNDIQSAIKLVGKVKRIPVYTCVHIQLAHSLDLYRERGEFDGSIESAQACLELAGFEIA
jgi:hypothetical protein